MSDAMREAFEARFPVPEGVYWDEKVLQYEAEHPAFEPDADAHHNKFIVWRTAALEHAGWGVCRQCNGRGLHHPSPDPSVIGTGPCSLCGGSGKGAPDFSQPPAPITCQLYGHEVQGCGECTPPAPVVPEPLADILRQMVNLHQEKGTVLTVHMNEVAILLDQINATPEPPHDR